MALVRRKPTQNRSKERMDRILDAAAHLFADKGYERVTTDMVARRAKTSVGSIYQFFPNKYAIFQAIADRYHERVRLLIEGLDMSPMPSTPWEKLVDRAVDLLVVALRSEPSFRAVWLNLHEVSHFIVEGEHIKTQIARETEKLVAVYSVGLSPNHRKVVASVIVELVETMLVTAARRRSRQGKLILEETKVVLRRYLGPYTKPAPRKAR